MPFHSLSNSIKQYLIVTANYWAFTLTDGALRMLVVLHFHQLGYSPLQVAMLFLFYEIFGVVTNLVGGWLGARLGLNRTMNVGLFLQIMALSMLLVPSEWLLVPWVMAAQAISGIAKDLNKMSAKSSIKTLLPKAENDRLFKWVAILTGSKNTLKGAGFFLGGGLLQWLGFSDAVLSMAAALFVVWVFSLLLLKEQLGKAKNKPKFRDIFSKSRAINILSAARLFLFASRDVWYVVALPVFLTANWGWDFWQVGGLLASWVIGYGFIQAFAPAILTRSNNSHNDARNDRKEAVRWSLLLLIIPTLMATGLSMGWNSEWLLIAGLLFYGITFAINSSLHSYLIVSFATEDGVSLDVGFYYMANAMGRLVGTVLSGWVYQNYGLDACLWVASGFVFITVIISFAIEVPNKEELGSSH